MIRTAKPDDAAAICSIYNPYVLGTTITFELEAVTVEAMAERIVDVSAILPWVIFEADGAVKAYAYATRWKAARPAYRYSVETTIYVGDNYRGQGLGARLYRDLIDKLKQQGMHRAIGGIALPNAGSLALHEKLGFKKVAHFEQVGWKFDRWIDVGYWQLSL